MIEVPVVLGRVTSIDYTSCRAIDDIIQNELEDKRNIILTGASKAILQTLTSQKALTHLPEKNIIDTRLPALQVAKIMIEGSQ